MLLNCFRSCFDGNIYKLIRWCYEYMSYLCWQHLFVFNQFSVNVKLILFFWFPEQHLHRRRFYYFINSSSKIWTWRKWFHPVSRKKDNKGHNIDSCGRELVVICISELVSLQLLHIIIGNLSLSSPKTILSVSFLEGAWVLLSRSMDS